MDYVCQGLDSLPDCAMQTGNLRNLTNDKFYYKKNRSNSTSVVYPGLDSNQHILANAAT